MLAQSGPTTDIILQIIITHYNIHIGWCVTKITMGRDALEGAFHTTILLDITHVGQMGPKYALMDGKVHAVRKPSARMGVIMEDVWDQTCANVMLVTKVTVVTNVNQEMVVCMGHAMSPTSATAFLGGLARSVLSIPTTAQNTPHVRMEGRAATRDLWDIHATVQKVLQGPIVRKKLLHPSVTMAAHQ